MFATDGAIMATLDVTPAQAVAATAPQPGEVADELARRRRPHRDRDWFLLALAGAALFYLTRGAA